MNNVSAMINNMKINTRKDNRFEGRMTVNGIRKSFYGNTKSEVKQKAKEYLQKIENGYREPKKITLNEYILYWLTTYKLNRVEPSTYTRLYDLYCNQIRDTIGTKKIGDLTSHDIQTFIDKKANPSDDNEKPISYSGLRKIYYLIRPCLDMAVKEELISKNPCRDVILPKEGCIKLETKKQYSLTDCEIEKFKEASLLKGKHTDEYLNRNGILLILLLNLGLRAGELLALEWTDVNMDNGIIYINKTVQSGLRNFENDGNTRYERVKQSTKTKAGNRILPMNEFVRFCFNELIEYDKRNGIKSNYVATTKNGTRVSICNLRKSLYSITKRSGIDKNISLHTLRHTFGSTLIRNGVGIEVVSELMGHSDITVTYNKYIHAVQEQKAIAMSIHPICQAD